MGLALRARSTPGHTKNSDNVHLAHRWIAWLPGAPLAHILAFIGAASITIPVAPALTVSSYLLSIRVFPGHFASHNVRRGASLLQPGLTDACFRTSIVRGIAARRSGSAIQRIIRIA